MSFLKAEWRKLLLANYVVDPKILEKYVPFGTELDFWNGHCYVSVVGFMFLNTSLLGIRIPFHANFEEVNLRFYVKRYDQGEWKRGVVFIKEIVPKPALTFVANTVYGEHYETLKMYHKWESKEDNLMVEYGWRKQKKWNYLKVNVLNTPKELVVNSETEFITEHYWGYAKVNEQNTNEYQVTHPKWSAFEIIDYKIDIDFGLNYGEEFAYLTNQKPHSVMLAEGSAITVENKTKLK